MQTPIYETSIYTYKSPLDLNPDDVIAFQVGGGTITVGINTIADYDRYYMSSDTPTFGDTFVSSDVGTIENAIASNSRGTSLSQLTINDLTIVNAGLGLTGYRKYEPLISSGSVYLGETFIPRMNITNSTLYTRVINKLYVTNSTLYAPLYRVMTNKITKVLWNYAYCLIYFPYYGGEYSVKDEFLAGGGVKALVLNTPSYKSTLNPTTGGGYKSSLSVPAGIPWTFDHPDATKKRLVDGNWVSEHWRRTQLNNGTIGPRGYDKNWDVWRNDGHKYLKEGDASWGRGIGAVGRFGRRFMKWFITKRDAAFNWNVSNRGRLIGNGDDDQDYVKSFLKFTTEAIGEIAVGQSWTTEGQYSYVWNFTATQNSANGTADQWPGRKQYMLPVTFNGVKYLLSEVPQPFIVYNGTNRWWSQVILYQLNANNIVETKTYVGLWAPNAEHIPADAPGNPFYVHWLPDIPYYNGDYGYGELPQTFLNTEQTALRYTDFNFAWTDDDTVTNYNDTLAVRRGTVYCSVQTSIPPYISATPGPQTSLEVFNLAKQQATDYGHSNPIFKIEDEFYNHTNQTPSKRTAGETNLHRYKVRPLKFTLKAVWSNGQVTTEFQAGESAFPQAYKVNQSHETSVDGATQRVTQPQTYVEQKTTGKISIPLDTSNLVNSTTQSINVRNLDNISGVGGLSASDIAAGGSTVTLAPANRIQTLYDNASKSGITSSSATSVGYFVSFADNVNSPDPEVSSRKLETTYNFGTLASGTTITYVNNIQPTPRGEIRIQNPGTVPRPVDVTTFVNELYAGSNFDTTRTFGFTLQSNQLRATRNNLGVSFPTTQIPSTLDNWTLSLNYNSITEPVSQNFYTDLNDTRGFSGPSSHNVFYTFNSSGQCLNNAVDGITISGQIITRQVEEQHVSVYEKFDILSTVENVWKHGMQIEVPAFNSDLLTSLGITPTYSPFKTNNTILRINASFVGNGLEPLNPVANDPFKGHLFDIPFNSGATLIDATTQDDLTDISNREFKTLDLKSYFGLLKTESILPQYILNSFSVNEQKILYIGYSLPPEFYVEDISGSSLNLVYRWGTESKYTQYSGSYTISLGSANISILDNLTPESSILSSYVRSDRERLFLSQPSGTSKLYMTTVRKNPTGYTFTEVEFPVTAYGGGDVRYKIYRSEEKIESGSQIQQIFDINNNSIGRTSRTPITFRKSTNPIIPSKFIDAGIGYTTSGNELRSISISKSPSSSALVNNFLVLEDASTTYKNTGSVYLFVTPDEIALSGPIIPAGVSDSFYMAEYVGTILGSKTGIPTFGPTLQSLSSWAINSAGDYIITNNLGGAQSAINTSETDVAIPFLQIEGRDPIQANGFITKTYEYNYFETITGGETGSNLYAIPFNWNENPNGSYNIAYANNYITLNYRILNGENAFGGWVPYENRSNYPVIVSKPLYVDMTFDLTKYYDDAHAGKTITNVKLYLYKDNRISYEFENVSGNTYTTRITDLQDSTIYGDLGNFYQIAGKLDANNSRYNIRLYTTRRFYVPDGLVIINGHIFTTTSYVQDPISKLTKQTITFNFNSGGEIRYEGTAIASGVQHRFAVVIDGVPETEFTLDPAVGASVRVNFLKPNTAYSVSLRYYPYANDADSRLHDLSEVKPTGFSFTTPVGSELTASISINPQTINDRIYDTIVNDIQLIETDNGTVTVKDISLIDFVFESQAPTMKIYSDRASSYKTFNLAAGFSQPIALQLEQLVRGKYYYPFVYLKDGDYYSNLVKVPNFQVRIRDDITSKLTSTSFSYNKLVTFDHLDIYDSFLVADYSTPSNEYGYLRIVNDSTDTGSITTALTYYASLNLADYADRKYPSSGVTLLMDKQLDKPAGVTLNFLKAYYSPYKPYDEGPNPALTIAADSTGKVPHAFGELDKIQDLKDLFNELTGFSLSGITLGDDSILYGDTVLCAYSGVGATGVLSIDFLANDNGIAQLVETFYGLDPTLTFYDPNNMYTGGVTITKSTDRIDLFGNVGYNQYLQSSTVPSNNATGVAGSCFLTYAQGAAYQDLNYSFDTAVISLKPLNTVINIHYIANQVGSLTDYIGVKVNYTAHECIYNGTVLEVSNPDDIASRVCVFRGDFPNQRDANNTPHPDLDYMFSLFKHFRDVLGYKFYFQSIDQVNDWNSSLVSNYWWTANTAKPLLSCPLRILNRYIELVKIPPFVIPSSSIGVEKMECVVTTNPAIYYGSVNVAAFNYYKGDSVNNSYPIVYNPTRLLLRQVGGPIFATANIDSTQLNYQDINFVLGSTMLSPNTTYNMALVFQYNSGSGWSTGTASRLFEYKVPADESNFDNVTQLVGIHKARIQIGNSIFGNKPLNDIDKQQQLTLYAKSEFNYKGEWAGATGYTLLDAVTYPDLNGTNRLYWLRDIATYSQALAPYFLAGWEDTSSYINFVGASPVSKNDVFTYDGKLYKVGNDGTMFLPDGLDKNINRYPDYDTNILASKSYPFDSGNTVIIDKLIPNMSYDVNFKLVAGNTYGPKQYYGDYNIATYKTLPDKIECKGYEGTLTDVVFSDVSYKNSSSFFKNGGLNYQFGVVNPIYGTHLNYVFSGVTCSFAYYGSDAPVLDNVYVTYTPQNLLETLGMEDQTDIYRPLVTISSTCTVQVIQPFYNMVRISVTDYNPKDVLGTAAGLKFIPSPSDSLIILKNGVFWQSVPLTNATFRYRLYDATGNSDFLQTADIDLTFSITGLNDKTSYSDFSIAFRVQGTSPVTGTVQPVPEFTTTPKLVINIDAGIGALKGSCNINKITYCDVVYLAGSSLFPYPNPKNKLVFRFRASESFVKEVGFESSDESVTSNSILPVKFETTNPTSKDNPFNYSFNQIYIEYHATNINGVLEKIVVLSSGSLKLVNRIIKNLNLIA